MIVLCGSAMSFLEKEVLAEKNPLYCRKALTAPMGDHEDALLAACGKRNNVQTTMRAGANGIRPAPGHAHSLETTPATALPSRCVSHPDDKAGRLAQSPSSHRPRARSRRKG